MEEPEQAANANANAGDELVGTRRRVCLWDADAEVGLRSGKLLHHGGVGSGFCVGVKARNFLARGFFELRAQLAVFHGFDGLGDLLLVQFHRLGEFAFEIGNAAALAVDPFGLQLAPLRVECPGLGRSVALRLLEIVAHAMQIGDQLRGFARGGLKQCAGALDHFARQAQALGDIEAA